MASTSSRLKKRLARKRQVFVRQAAKYNRPGLAAAVEATGESPESLLAAYEEMTGKMKSPEEMVRVMEARGEVDPPEVRARKDMGDAVFDCAICEALARSGHDPGTHGTGGGGVIRIDYPEAFLEGTQRES